MALSKALEERIAQPDRLERRLARGSLERCGRGIRGRGGRGIRDRLLSMRDGLLAEVHADSIELSLGSSLSAHGTAPEAGCTGHKTGEGDDESASGPGDDEQPRLIRR